MNFTKFPVASTNIFPIANTVNGGQLVTEFNLRSRESVYSDSRVQYIIGPSFVHSEEDYKVTVQQGSGSTYFPDTAATTTSVLQISKGRAVINGHYVECLTDITIDLIEENRQAALRGETTLSGNLSVGLRAMYSAELNLSGTIEPEATDGPSEGLYKGIQVVILPTEDFILPKDSPTDESLITAHLLLATFNYTNGTITKLINNPDRCAMIGADRIQNIDDILSQTYLSKENLNPMRYYTLGGKYDLSNGRWSIDWCDATSSTMIWDSNVHIVTEQPVLETAQFVSQGSTVALAIPHKQIDGMANGSANGSGTRKFFAPVVLQIPTADYETGTAGVVDSAYTDRIKEIDSKIRNIYTLSNGKQRAYLKELGDRSQLPLIDGAWDVGDYVLVGMDSTIQYTLQDSSRKPSTIYAVVPGVVLAIHPHGFAPLPDTGGVELARIVSTTQPNITDPDVYNSSYWNLQNYTGRVNKDYFTYVYHNDVTDSEIIYYFLVKSAGAVGYSDAILLTGGVPLAEENLIGGFLSAPPTALDGGYISIDSKGYLRLLDYDLLRSGALAYQLGQDYTVPNGLTIEEIQAYLDEFVNQRVAFPNATQLQNSDSMRIHIYLEISDVETENGVLSINGIDSRFNTSVCLHITYAEGVKCTINISDCEKIQIDPDIRIHETGSNVNLNIYRTCIYYNADIFDFSETMKDISLWYERFDDDDPILTVDGMTVSQLTIGDAYTNNNVASMTNWTTISQNDNHFDIALHSLTFSSNGFVEGCEIYVRNNSTVTVQTGKYIIRDSKLLPQGPDLMYPTTRMTQPINITGQFVSASVQNNTATVQNTMFSMITQTYMGEDKTKTGGDIAFLVDVSTIPVEFETQIAEWGATKFHCFSGKLSN